MGVWVLTHAKGRSWSEAYQYKIQLEGKCCPAIILEAEYEQACCCGRLPK
jgi:hypothetical protein